MAPWRQEDRRRDRTQCSIQVKGVAIPSPELCLEASPSQPGVQCGTRIHKNAGVESTGGKSQLKRSARLLEKRTGSSLEALSDPSHWHFPSTRRQKSCWGYRGGDLSQIPSDLKILFVACL